MNIMEAINVAREIAVVNRYSMNHLNRSESVLEHTGGVCLLSLIIGLEHGDVDMGELLMKAAVHDLEEAKIGDIANPVKYHNASILKEIQKVGLSAIQEISNNLELPDIAEIWINSKDDTIEGRIVRLADVISVLAKIYEEAVMYSNISFVEYAHNTLAFFKEQKEVEKDAVLLDVINGAIQINEGIINANL